jgi:hypothetical protein
MMKESPRVASTLTALALLLLCACNRQDAQAKPQWVATGRVMFTAGTKTLETHPKDLPLDTLYEKQIEILTGGELHAQALERIRALHPELKECEVQIHAEVMDRSSIIEVRATGTEGNYTSKFLDGLLDEAIVLRKKQLDASGIRLLHDMVQKADLQERRYLEARTRYFEAKERGAPDADIGHLEQLKTQAKADFEVSMKALEAQDYSLLYPGALDSLAVMDRPNPSVQQH